MKMRLWPGFCLLALQWGLRFGLPLILEDGIPYAILGSLALGVLIMLWWAFFSKTPHGIRWWALLAMVLAPIIVRPLIHPSINTGMMGMMYPVYVVPTLCLALVGWALIGRNWQKRRQLLTLPVFMLLAAGAWTLVRTGGFTGDVDQDFAFRWTPTPEELMLAQAKPLNEASAIAFVTPEWPGFRGPRQDGSVSGTSIHSDWLTHPPEELWRSSIGPGWSSFAVQGDYFYTQEQRGEVETVSCYRMASGAAVWRHEDPVRFWESNAGAGPRSTPTLDRGMVFALGATGLVNALDATSGALLWQRDAAAETEVATPDWGFSGSPVVSGETLLVPVAGTLIAYQRLTGDPLWQGPKSGVSYCTPQLFESGSGLQVLQLHEGGLTSFAPQDGQILWEYPWKGYPIIQPAVLSSSELLVAVTAESGLRRLNLEDPLSAPQEVWTTQGLKPYFNDFVVHGDYAYGFDGRILACIELTSGERVWKGGRYGNGQLILLTDQDLLLVLSERGDLALVQAKPDEFKEWARVPALKGKTWNHPVLVNGTLLVRNAEEMAAFRL
ncbi:MAG: PQQ-like beta-propeller repeat protein [Acidobacteria bacterium]|nr:PQQ-like beta-propeller repeat protein [Acidobacteriota bacterium]